MPASGIWPCEVVVDEALLDALFEDPHVHVALMRPDFTFIRVNRTYAEGCRLPPEFFPGRNHFELFPHPENESIFREVVATGRPYSVTTKPFRHPYQPERGFTWWDWSLKPLFAADGRMWGVLLSLVDVTDGEIARLLAAERETLLRETNHRIKNNLQMATGFLMMQKAGRPDLAEVIDPVIGRLDVIGRIHDALGTQHMPGAEIDFVVYARALCDDLESLYGDRGISISVGGSAWLPADVVVPLGLALHELVCNAIKHAFPQGRPGRIAVEVGRAAGTGAFLAVADDGIGLQPDCTAEGLGSRILDRLTRQLQGSLRVGPRPGGGTLARLDISESVLRPDGRQGG